jgi:sulfur carrier protein
LITIQVNGEKKEIPDGLKLAALVEWLKLPSDRVAVEHNLEIVPRNLWQATAVNDGDRLEVVHFVGGGTDFRFRILDLRY